MGCKFSRDNNAKTMAVPWDTLDDLDTDFDPNAYVANILKAKNRRASKNSGEIYDSDCIALPRDIYRKMRKNRTKRGGSYSDSDSNASLSRTVETIMVDNLSEAEDDGFSSLLPPQIINFRKGEYGNDHKKRNRGGIGNNKIKSFKIEELQPTFSDSKSSSSSSSSSTSSFDDNDLISFLRRSRRTLKTNGLQQSYFSPPPRRSFFEFNSTTTTTTCQPQLFFPEETAHIRMFLMFKDSDKQLSQSLL